MTDRTGITNNNAVDIHVGKQIRLRRNFLGMTQQDLARRLDVTFQQVQKYERGANRVSASRLWDISQIMKTEISYFFDGYARILEKSIIFQGTARAGMVSHCAGTIWPRLYSPCSLKGVVVTT